jgi:uncharacterized protein (DUF302 family)
MRCEMHSSIRTRRISVNKTVLTAVIAFVGGVVLTAVVGWLVAPGVMMNEDPSSAGFDETVETIQEEAAAQGWAVPNVLRLDRSVAGDGYDVARVAVIELCNPAHAGPILETDEGRVVTSMMPCRVAVYETSDGEVVVNRMNTGLVSQMFGGLVAETMATATEETEEIFEAVLE